MLSNKNAKGSQPESRTAEQRRKSSEASQRYYARKTGKIMEGQPDEGPPIMLVKPLAPGAVNPMWETNDNIVMLANSLARGPFIFKKPKKYERTNTPSGFYMKEVEIPEEDEPITEPEEEKKI